MIVPFLIGTLAVLFMFQANYLIFLFKEFSISAIPLTATLQILLYKSPEWLNMTLPIGTSLAAALAISRLTRESEITAMRSAGASIRRILMPVVGFGLLVAIGNFFMAEEVMPRARNSARSLFAQVALVGGAPEFKSNVTLQLQNKVAIIGTVARGANNTIQLSSVLLYEKPNETTTMLVRAERGEYRDGNWTLPNYYVWIMEGESLVSATSSTTPMVIREPVTVESIFSPKEPEELSSDELLRQIKDLKKQGFDTRAPEVQYHTRFSVPTSCIIFALVAPIFSVLFARSGAFVGVLLSLVVVLLYYNGFIISTQILGRNGIVPPWLAAWLPNLVFAAFGVIATRWLE